MPSWHLEVEQRSILEVKMKDNFVESHFWSDHFLILLATFISDFNPVTSRKAKKNVVSHDNNSLKLNFWFLQLCSV